MNAGELAEKAKKIRINVIRMLCEAGTGHPGGSLSAADLVTALYFSVMKHDPKKPGWNGRDVFILSKGHVCPVLYAVLAEAGYFKKEELFTLRKLDSRLEGHPSKEKGLPGIEVSSGSLGMGLSVANGVALGFKLDGLEHRRVYCLMGDGELQEGQIWEAAMTAAHYKLDNVCAIVDHNKLQIDGKVGEVKNVEPLKEKWEAFGWKAIELDGHDMAQILDGFEKAKAAKGMPVVIIAHTVKGKGVSFMENQVEWHGKAPKKEQMELALKELGG
jgi:transketolase